MPTARMSVMGMYSYDNTIFNEFVCPSELNRELAIDSILLECAELECKYPHPVYLAKAINLWSTREFPIWKKLWETTQYVYNPIENYDRTEETTENSRESSGTENHVATEEIGENGAERKIKDDVKGTSKNTLVGSSQTDRNETKSLEHGQVQDTNYNETTTTTDSGTDVNTVTNSGDDTTTHSVAAFDSDSLKNTEKDVTSHGRTETGRVTHGKTSEEKHTGNNSVNMSGTDVETLNGKETTTTNDTNTGETSEGREGSVTDTEKTKNNINTTEATNSNTNFGRELKTRTHGNIGVTTTQQMIQQERDIVQFDIYEHIVNSFKLNFCLLVY